MKISLIIVVKNMLVKYNVNRLETILKNKFPEINPELYYSRRKKLVIWRLINVFMNTETIRSFWMK